MNEIWSYVDLCEKLKKKLRSLRKILSDVSQMHGPREMNKLHARNILPRVTGPKSAHHTRIVRTIKLRC